MWVQSDIDALKAALSTGVLEVTYDGPPRRTVVYQSLAQMRILLAGMAADVAAQSGQANYRLFATRKGFR